MNRAYLYHRASCLLAMLLCVTCLWAQSSRLEYWFDKYEEEPQTLYLPGGSLEFFVDAKGLSEGLHTMFMRAKSNDGTYSPIYTAYFMKLPEGAKKSIAYWLDDNYRDRKVVDASLTNENDSILNVSLDFSAVPEGVHRLKLRITSDNTDSGVIYEYPILVTRHYNMSSAAPVVVEGEHVWYDDEAYPAYAEIATKGSVVTRSYTLNPNDFAVGQHAFHIQYKNSVGVWGEQNVTYFYKDASSGRLKIALMPTGLNEVEADNMCCTYFNGSVFIDCQSSRLGTTGIVKIYNINGGLISQQTLVNTNGIHAQIKIDGCDNQVIIAELISGDFRYVKKLFVR